MLEDLSRRIPFLLSYAVSILTFSVIAFFLPSIRLHGQTLQESKPMGGSATGGVYAPVLDSKRRPITAGGFVDGAPVYYEDVTEKTGMNVWRNHTGTLEKNYILELATGGVALFDYDGDGLLDVYFVNGSTYAALRGQEPAPRAALFHNNGDGTFTDVTEKAGVGNYRWGMGVAVGDYNNDGCPDLYVTNYGKNRLYRNNCDGTFTDIAEEAHVTVSGARPVWSTGATFGDYDRDGRLDLFVAGYVQFDIENLPAPGNKVVDYSDCAYRGVPVVCGPRGLAGERDYLFHNNGDGTFTEVAEKAGVADPKGFYGFGTAFADVNDDGWPDLLVANDSTPRYLYLNRGNGTFEDASFVSGFALNENGREQASMGLALGDYDNDGRLDVYVTNFSDDYNTLYHNEGNGNFADVAFRLGLGSPTIPFLGWGTAFIDFDNDGWKDIFCVNGHVYRTADSLNWGSTWAQRPLLFRNIRGKRFELMPAATGSGLAVVNPARGAAFGDLFNDGRIAVVINNLEAPPTVLRNVTRNANHWIEIQLEGGLKSPRDAIGAKVFLTAGGIRQRGDIISGGGYISQNDMRVHFGLGTVTTIQKLEVQWPDGVRENIAVPSLDRIWKVVEGKGVVRDTRVSAKR